MRSFQWGDPYVNKILIASALVTATALAGCSSPDPTLNEYSFRQRLDQTHKNMMRPARDIKFEGPDLANQQSRVLALRVDSGKTLIGPDDRVHITREPSGSTRVTYFLNRKMIALRNGRCERIETQPKLCSLLRPHEWTQVYELGLAFGKRNAPKF